MGCYHSSELSNEEEVLKELNTGSLEERMEKLIRFASRAYGWGIGLGLQNVNLDMDFGEAVRHDILEEAKKVSALVDQKEEE